MRKIKKSFLFVVIVVLAVGAYTVFFLHKPDANDRHHAVIFLIESTPTDFHLVPVERQIKEPPSPASAVRALLDGPLDHEVWFESVPKGTELLDLVVRDNLATVNFSSEIKDNFPGGSLMEAYLVEAIVNTLTEFSNIERVQIMVQGEIIESIGGHVLITRPIRRSN